MVLSNRLQVSLPEKVVRHGSLKGPLQPQTLCDFVTMCTLFSFMFSDTKLFTVKHNKVYVALGIFSLKYKNEGELGETPKYPEVRDKTLFAVTLQLV